MTILSAHHQSEAYERGFQEGQAQALEGLEQDKVRRGMIQSMKYQYEQKVEKAEKEGYLHGYQKGEESGYQLGLQDGRQEGRAEGRRERVEEIFSLKPEETIATIQGREQGRKELADYLRQVLAQVKEGSAVAAVIAGRIEDAIAEYMKSRV